MPLDLEFWDLTLNLSRLSHVLWLNKLICGWKKRYLATVANQGNFLALAQKRIYILGVLKNIHPHTLDILWVLQKNPFKYVPWVWSIAKNPSQNATRHPLGFTVEPFPIWSLILYPFNKKPQTAFVQKDLCIMICIPQQIKYESMKSKYSLWKDFQTKAPNDP